MKEKHSRIYIVYERLYFFLVTDGCISGCLFFI